VGFEFSDPTFVLEFEDGSLEGLEVKAKSQTLGAFLDMTALAAIGSNPTPQDMANVGKLLEGFAEVLVDWNVEIGGKRVEPDLDGLRRLKFADVFKMISAWIKVTASAPGPLGETSSGGSPSEVLLPPMAPLSTSLAS
jgi:hypothetical protein